MSNPRRVKIVSAREPSYLTAEKAQATSDTEPTKKRARSKMQESEKCRSSLRLLLSKGLSATGRIMVDRIKKGGAEYCLFIRALEKSENPLFGVVRVQRIMRIGKSKAEVLIEEWLKKGLIQGEENGLFKVVS